jgi:hypothetical protein
VSTEINDLVTAAIQTYAATLPNPDFKLNLLAAAEDMAPKLIETLVLKQEWGLVHAEKFPHEPETINEIAGTTENRYQAYDELNCLRELELKYPHQGYGDDENGRVYIGTRLFTDWTEEQVIILNEEEQHQMDIDQGVVSG